MQFDVETAYFNAPLSEEIFMRQPDGFANGKKVLRLRKSLYGLKQAGREWYHEMHRTMESIGFKRNEKDWAIYSRNRGGDVQILVLYVDDFLLMGNNPKSLEETTRQLKRRYKMHELGEPKWFLGIQLVRNRESRTIELSQRSLIEAALKKYGLDDSSKYSTPADTKVHLSKNDCPQNDFEKETMENVPYREAVGTLMYIAQRTRPDILHSASVCAQFNANPGVAHWKAVKRVYKYLNESRDKVLKVGGFDIENNTLHIEAYSDADYGNNVDDRTSVSGGIFFINGISSLHFAENRNPLPFRRARQNTLPLAKLSKNCYG